MRTSKASPMSFAVISRGKPEAQSVSMFAGGGIAGRCVSVAAFVVVAVSVRGTSATVGRTFAQASEETRFRPQ